MATTIRLRLVLTLLLVVGGGALVQVVAFLVQRSDTVAIQAYSDRMGALVKIGHGLGEVIDEQHDAVLTYLLTDDLAGIETYNRARVEEAVLLESSASGVGQDATLAGILDSLGQATAAWRASFADPSIALMQSDREAAASAPGRIRRGEDLFREVLMADQAFDARLDEFTRAGVLDLERIQEHQLLAFLVGLLGAMAGILAAIWLLERWVLHPLGNLLTTARRVEAGDDVAFRADRDDEIGELGRALEHMRQGLSGQAAEAGVVNRFTELTAFVEADGDVARATLDALGELAAPDSATIHISNRSKDRAIPEGSSGPVTPEVVSLGQLASCPGIRRSSLYVVSDLAASMSVHCPVFTAATGTLACLPLLALGEVVGAVHLHWEAPGGLPLEIHAAVSRIADHASLSIANRRLMTALQGMAATDGRTGLANSRAFDDALEACLTRRDPGEPTSVLMLDIDHFKDFNDRNGHPAGDEALRTFARVLAGSVRDGDLVARYGGEEFVVMLPGATPADAQAVAERIRSHTEATVIDLSPGHRDQVTVSIGIATWPADARERVKLLEAADAALYRAKGAGRNRVVVASEALAARSGDTDARLVSSDPEDAGAGVPPLKLARAG